MTLSDKAFRVNIFLRFLMKIYNTSYLLQTTPVQPVSRDVAGILAVPEEPLNGNIGGVLAVPEEPVKRIIGGMLAYLFIFI